MPTIEAKWLPIELPIPLTPRGNHIYFEIWDDNGNRVTQINGLATDKDGNIKTVGSQRDFIYGYTDLILSSTEGATRTNHPHDGVELFSGSQQDVSKAIQYTESAIAYINAQNFSYALVPTAGEPEFNSNSVFSTVLDAMRQTVSIPQSAVEAAEDPPGLNPGVRKDMFQGNSWAPNVNDPGEIKGSIVRLAPNRDKLIGSPHRDFLYGNDRDNVLIGGDEDDTIIPGEGNNYISGGGGSFNALNGNVNGVNIYHIAEASGKTDLLPNFKPGVEYIHMPGYSFSDLDISSAGPDAIVSFGNDQQITLWSAAGKLTERDFIFTKELPRDWPGPRADVPIEEKRPQPWVKKARRDPAAMRQEGRGAA